ncbi:SDR family oxidoreductase [Solirubrobacter soli]|uniref:SDR family oxidoreductase n=1 Tax=Solirubrobacter soli TaxID=363832 RepID=UPI000401A691|nr:SDR family oxidoreductase [Solirubrobacter soli]
MEIAGQIVVVTGASRGLGRSLVEALLERGAAKVYATTRNGSLAHPDPRVVPLALALDDRTTITVAARAASDARIIINNAGTAAFAGALEADRAALRHEMDVNYGGTLDVIRAFVPVLERNGGGAIVNVLSLLSLASTPPMAGYSASKAAAHSLTQALRPVLRAQGISVHGVYPAGIDTDMLAGIDAPKSPPATVAEGLLDGLAADEEDIFPDPNARAMAETWWSNPKSFERAFAGS